MKTVSSLFLLLFGWLPLVAQQAPTFTTVEWSGSMTIYEVNVRQFSEQGTFKAVEARLPELKALGVGILWLMPINPIGEQNRKGPLGSYYAVRNYTGINPEFGTEAHFHDLVKAAHQLEMKVIIDWVANHTSWDHPWVKTNPDYFTKNDKGEMVPPVADWQDVVDLNYDNKDLRKDMIEAMKYWVSEFNIDGFRCDVAGMVPVDFWDAARRELDAIKPVFMLAEAHEAALHVNAFDMTYGWQQKDYFNKLAAGTLKATDLINYYTNEEQKHYHPSNYRMLFITNHDENSWNGNEYKRLGDAYQVMSVLTFTLPGMPLIYNGQEAGMTQELKFFERDPIQWKDHPNRAFFTNLTWLRKDNKALWSGSYGGSLTWLEAGNKETILSFKREKEGNTVVVVANLSKDPGSFELKGMGPMNDYFTGKTEKNLKGKLKPWEFRVYVSE
ncbi:MAG: alpha-glucosidase C-terminal domain-containing protein [Bacteroidetes bacterium]|nr:alpha-glucosidase C-terminal domain-containing protein [Bacteroidota bacterium]